MNKKMNFVATAKRLASYAALVIAMVTVFTACSKEFDDEMGVDYTPNNNNNGGFSVVNENLVSAYSDDAVLNHAMKIDTMTSTMKLSCASETFVKNPVYSTELVAEGDIQKIDSYELTAPAASSAIVMTDAADDVTNFDGACYKREKRQSGSFNVTGRTIKVNNYTSCPEQMVNGVDGHVCMPHTLNNNTKFAGYRVIEIGAEETIDGAKYKKVRFGVSVQVQRNRMKANSVSAGTYATETVEVPMEYYVKSNAEEPVTMTEVILKDKNYTIDEVGKKVISNVIFTKVFSDGTRRDTTFTENLPFNNQVPADVTRNQNAKGLSYVNSSNNTNTVGSLIKTNTLTSTHIVRFADNSTANLAFIGTYSTGSIVVFQGTSFERTEVLAAPVMTQAFAAVDEVNTTTSGNVTTTEYKVTNDVVIGSYKFFNNSKVFVKVTEIPAEVILTGVVLKDKNWTIVGSNVKSNIIYSMTFSNGVKRDTTFTHNFPFSNTPASNVTRDQEAKGLTYANSSNNTSTTGGLIKTHTLTSTHVVKFNDASVANLAFIGTYGSGSIVVFGGTSFERTEEFSTPVMTQTFGNIQEVGTTTSGNVATTEYKVVNNIAMGTYSNANSSKVYVKVTEEEYNNPEKGQLIGHRGRTLSPTAAHALQTIDVFEWTNGYDVYVNGVFNGYWKKSDMGSAINNYTGTLSATCNGVGGKWMPAIVTVDNSRGYWYYQATSANGTQYSSATSYLNLNKKANDWLVATTWAFVGSNLVVKNANGQVVLTISRS